jgi:hypothetical protein
MSRHGLFLYMEALMYSKSSIAIKYNFLFDLQQDMIRSETVRKPPLAWRVKITQNDVYIYLS